MTILYLTKYTRMAGSSRLRSYQYFPSLEQAGMKVTVKPFFDEVYLNDFYAGKKNRGAVIKSYVRRFFVLLTVLRYDQVVIEKELFPFLPAFAEWLLKAVGIQYLVDYDDAIFHNYDQSTNPIIKKILGNKIAKVMRYSGTVVAGNHYLADYARKAGAKSTVIIPTVIDLVRYPVRDKKESADFVIGWIGTKTTFEKHLLPQKSWMLKAQEIEGVRFRLVGITSPQNLGEKVEYIPWTEDSEVNEIEKFDVGIMPLQDSLWEKGKCSYKLIQYFACGIPAIASPVGMNTEVVVPGENGFLARTEEEWLSAIQYLKNQKQVRHELGKAGRQKVERQYCLQVTAQQWVGVLEGRNKTDQ